MPDNPKFRETSILIELTPIDLPAGPELEGPAELPTVSVRESRLARPQAGHHCLLVRGFASAGAARALAQPIAQRQQVPGQSPSDRSCTPAQAQCQSELRDFWGNPCLPDPAGRAASRLGRFPDADIQSDLPSQVGNVSRGPGAAEGSSGGGLGEFRVWLCPQPTGAAGARWLRVGGNAVAFGIQVRSGLGGSDATGDRKDRAAAASLGDAKPTSRPPVISQRRRGDGAGVAKGSLGESTPSTSVMVAASPHGLALPSAACVGVGLTGAAAEWTDGTAQLSFDPTDENLAEGSDTVIPTRQRAPPGFASSRIEGLPTHV